VDAVVPDNVRNFSERVTADKVADGVWFLAGGSHNSVAIEMKDQVIVVETPLYDGRAAAVLAKARELVPGKPVRTVINSHHHFDHAGGLRAAVARRCHAGHQRPGQALLREASSPTPTASAPT
jgi:glyoxylase-like metal-dependent hydrolase (beta-lactamase superfamily II)